MNICLIKFNLHNITNLVYGGFDNRKHPIFLLEAVNLNASHGQMTLFGGGEFILIIEKCI